MVSSGRWGDRSAGKQPDKAEPQSCLCDLPVLSTPEGRGHGCLCPLPVGLSVSPSSGAVSRQETVERAHTPRQTICKPLPSRRLVLLRQLSKY